MPSAAPRAPSGPARGRRPRGGARGAAWRVGLLLGCASCSQSDSFIGAQIDYQLRQGETPALDLAQVGPARWSRMCVLGPGTDDARADGDFSGVQPPCLSRAEAKLATRREPGGGLRVVQPGGP